MKHWPTTGRGRTVALVGGFGALLALLIAAGGLGLNSKSSALPRSDGSATQGPDVSGASLIPGTIATTSASGRATASQRPIAKKSGTAKPVSTSAKSSASSAAGSSDSATAVSSSTITPGDSKANCIYANFPGGLDQSTINGITDLTGVTYNCVSTFANPVASWTLWEQPWMFIHANEGYSPWLAANPKHQIVMAMDLIPKSVSDNSDPDSWEQPCAGGDFNRYATTLAKNLVSYGAGNIIIRLGPEANGPWEADYIGTTSSEMANWAKCYANEVTAMRVVAGANFLFVWNPNICANNIPLSAWYPGNSYVDIIGADAYDKDCESLKTVGQEGWEAYDTDGSSPTSADAGFPSLANIESFAVANGKPMSFPEWGIDSDGGDDPAYVTDMLRMFHDDDFAYQSYFDNGSDGIAQLGSSIPAATAGYAQAFK